MEQALAIARLEDRRFEVMHLGNLGDAFVKVDRLDEAEAAFREAIPIGDQAFPTAAGAFRGSLALLLAKQGPLDEVQTLLEFGETQVDEHPEEHAVSLQKAARPPGWRCRRALAALNQAQKIVAELKVSDDSEVGQALAELVALMGRFDPDGGPSGSLEEGATEEPTNTGSDEERELALIEVERLFALGDIEQGREPI